MTRAELKAALTKLDETITPGLTTKEDQKALAEAIQNFTGQKISVSLTMDVLRAVHELSKISDFEGSIKIERKKTKKAEAPVNK